MAYPIQPTPTLEGEDAVRFYRELQENQGKVVSEEEIRRGSEIFYGVVEKNPWLKAWVGDVRY